ncbi:hypothetical protein DVS28_a1086 [Euzebya pacifica]|uniref:Uncharacterized protein n=1 Tax=Euzebya pacifica TaxID=1608957 RepID=A0A346XU90_9ACTN|nr:hypothetical protein DVS28_a1086 [Euzebya pacifica]
MTLTGGGSVRAWPMTAIAQARWGTTLAGSSTWVRPRPPQRARRPQDLGAVA